MKLAFIVQRYGAEVLGGSEYHCRLIAERLAPHHDVEVLTTCARDYVTWKNEYPEGPDRIRGVTVRRFANQITRDIGAFDRLSDWIFNNAHTADDELEWLKQQGPWSPPLFNYLNSNHQRYDVLIFFTYLYATTVLGVEVSPARSVLVPTAHDEPAIRLEIYKGVFSRPAAIMFNTDVERRFLKEQFASLPAWEETVGVGIDFPQHQPYPRMPAAVEQEPQTDDSVEEASSREFPSHLTSRGAVFRRRHRLYGPIALYGGRIDPGKGCEELIEYFGRYAEQGGDAILTLMGVKLMPLPETSFIKFAGLLSDRERLQALEAATVVICPSPYESLSLLALEAMSVGTPILVNGRSPVLVEHCVRSHAGLYYADGDEFVESLKLLVRDDSLRAAMGRNGRDYVRRNYRWDVVLGKYERVFAKIRGAR
ncbi:MAG TPA: glycosyltransferase family 4 protein [Vicinamibacterales bacterium]|nr:glycosyltransferase family 4 protein [Vicinamibacterales bacterium]